MWSNRAPGIRALASNCGPVTARLWTWASPFTILETSFPHLWQVWARARLHQRHLNLHHQAVFSYYICAFTATSVFQCVLDWRYNSPKFTNPGTVLSKYYVLADAGSQSNPYPWQVCHSLYWFCSLFSLPKSLTDIMNLIVVIKRRWKIENSLISVLHIFFLKFQEYIKLTCSLSAFPLTPLIC